MSHKNNTIIIDLKVFLRLQSHKIKFLKFNSIKKNKIMIKHDFNVAFYFMIIIIIIIKYLVTILILFMY